MFHLVAVYDNTSVIRTGIVSEHLATKRYGPEQERFRQLEGLNGAQAFACFVWAWLILLVMQLTGQIQPGQTASWLEYWKAGISNSLGPAFGMVALKNITYSAQVRVLLLVACKRPCTAHACSSWHPCHASGDHANCSIQVFWVLQHAWCAVWHSHYATTAILKCGHQLIRGNDCCFMYSMLHGQLLDAM